MKEKGEGERKGEEEERGRGERKQKAISHQVPAENRNVIKVSVL